MILTPQELKDLTRKMRPSAQRRQLDFLHIPYTPREDGSLIVFWADVRQSQEPKRREPQLRLDA